MNKKNENRYTNRVCVADLLIDLEKGTVSRGGVAIDLPDLSWRLLKALVTRAPHRASKDELIREVWEGVVVSDETLSQRVKLLRQSLAGSDGKDRYIASIRNHGYRLVPEVLPVKEGVLKQLTANRRWAWGALILVLLAIAWSGFQSKPLPSRDLPRAVAVLPFADLSPASDSQYFADGLHEELLGRLAQIDDLDVVSRTSVLPFRNTGLSVAEIASRLGVDVLIEGSVRRSGKQLRLSMQVIDVRTDRHLWAETFERELSIENLFAIQVEIAEAVARAMELQISGVQRSKLVQLPTNSIEAYDLYLLGRYNTFQLTREGLENGITWLNRAVELDPGFASAWATLGWAYSFQGTTYGDSVPREAYQKATEAALRALSLNPELADAHSLYADILAWYDWDWVAAEREYLAAMERDPYNVLGYSLFLSTQLRHSEALGLIEKLLKRFPGNDYYHVNAAWRYFNARDYVTAIEQAKLSSNHADSNTVRAWALMSSGQIGQALEIFQREYASEPEDPAHLSDLAIVLHRLGERVRAQELLERLLAVSEERFVSPVTIAAVYFEMDQSDEAFSWMDKAVASRSRELIFLQVDHVYDAHRSDPRYLALKKRLGFP